MLFLNAGDTKRVMFSKYGFSIPGDASVLGVEISFSYSTTANTTVLDDKNVLLLYWGTQGGFDKSASTPAYVGTNSVVLGGPTDTWGWFLTPADVNDDGFGFNFKLNCTTVGINYAFLNGVQITVYYLNPNGIVESQKSYAQAKLTVKDKQVNFISEYNETSEISIYNLSGERVFYGSIEANANKVADLQHLQNGLYLYSIKQNGKEKTGKFLLD